MRRRQWWSWGSYKGVPLALALTALRGLVAVVEQAFFGLNECKRSDNS